jgi:YfiR/HmsC-like
VRRCRSLEEAGRCQILFIPGQAGIQAGGPSPLAALRGESLLTVGESDAFERAGGIIRLLLVDNHVRLRINLAAAEAAHLTISSQLLRQAELIGRERG